MRSGLLEDSEKGEENSLSGRAKEIYEELYNSAWEQYEDSRTRRGNSSREETAHHFAWAAVKEVFKKDVLSSI